MKRILFLFTTLTFSVAVIAQGNSDGNKDKTKDKGKPAATDQSGKNKDKEKADKEKKELDNHNKKIWEGTSDKSGGPKASKNQPTKVSSAFQRDYPNATNVYWTKYRGDWTATFGNGIWRSTAVYHANGERRDTRTLVSRENVPRKILDVIFKQKPEAKVDEAIKIEVPRGLKDIFRIKDIINGKAEFQYYDADGIKVQYNY